MLGRFLLRRSTICRFHKLQAVKNVACFCCCSFTPLIVIFDEPTNDLVYEHYLMLEEYLKISTVIMVVSRHISSITFHLKNLCLGTGKPATISVSVYLVTNSPEDDKEDKGRQGRQVEPWTGRQRGQGKKVKIHKLSNTEHRNLKLRQMSDGSRKKAQTKSIIFYYSLQLNNCDSWSLNNNSDDERWLELSWNWILDCDISLYYQSAHDKALLLLFFNAEVQYLTTVGTFGCLPSNSTALHI